MQAEFIHQLQIVSQSCISVAGSGGKSTLIKHIAQEAVEAGWPAVITTTTHIHLPFYHLEENLLIAEEKDISCDLIHSHLCCPSHNPLILVNRKVAPNKASGFSPEKIGLLQSRFLILVEADGSRCKPFKIPADYEPVIPSITTHTVLVFGLCASGQPLDETRVHRLHLLPHDYTETTISANLVARILTSPEYYIRKIPGTSRVMVYLAGCDDMSKWNYARDVAYEIRQKETEWPIFAGNIEEKAWIEEIVSR